MKIFKPYIQIEVKEIESAIVVVEKENSRKYQELFVFDTYDECKLVKKGEQIFVYPMAQIITVKHEGKEICFINESDIIASVPKK